MDFDNLTNQQQEDYLSAIYKASQRGVVKPLKKHHVKQLFPPFQKQNNSKTLNEEDKKKITKHAHFVTTCFVEQIKQNLIEKTNREAWDKTDIYARKRLILGVFYQKYKMFPVQMQQYIISMHS